MRSGLCAGQSSSSTPTWKNHFFLDLALCMESLSNRKKCCLKQHSMLLHLRFPFIGPKGPTANHEEEERTTLLIPLEKQHLFFHLHTHRPEIHTHAHTGPVDMR